LLNGGWAKRRGLGGGNPNPPLKTPKKTKKGFKEKHPQSKTPKEKTFVFFFLCLGLLTGGGFFPPPPKPQKGKDPGTRRKN